MSRHSVQEKRVYVLQISVGESRGRYLKVNDSEDGWGPSHFSTDNLFDALHFDEAADAQEYYRVRQRAMGWRVQVVPVELTATPVTP